MKHTEYADADQVSPSSHLDDRESTPARRFLSKVALTKAQRLEVNSLVEDSGYKRSEAICIVLAGGI